jgi:SH3-like domain-containing protein
MASMVTYCAWQIGVAVAAVATVVVLGMAQSEAETAIGPKSGLPVPRFVSLKPDRVNVRAGPTRDHDVAFVYTRAGLPVEITAESDNWRRIRDWEGSEGWVYHSLLSGKRTALLAPKDKTQLVPLYDRSDSNGTVIAQLQAGVLAQVKHCSANWCRISGPRFDGWVVQEQLWGVYANETFP